MEPKEKRTPSNNAKRSRRKGHQFERDIAIKLRCVFPEARRHLEYQMAEANGVDIVNTGEFFFQCKKLKAYSPISAISEVQCDQLLGDVPVLVTAGDGLAPMAVLPFDDLLRLIKKAKGV